MKWFVDHQREDGLWDLSYDGKATNEKKDQTVERAWLSLRICRMLRRFRAN